MMGLKAVGLISGGKDSIFAIYYARELGHDICAVATLLPTEGTTESDSFMYQSIGTGITAAIAECMDIPHYTRVVEGKPICTETLHYKKTEGDEVEDLFNLLSHVKHSIPDLQAVTCGAILSEYQRRRVEEVCKRLDLVPICLLWNRQEEALLQEMIDWGLHAVVVKTASFGLSKEHLGRSIKENAPHFSTLNAQLGFHVCGEGGEYETVTLNCPLFEKGFIEVTEWQEIFEDKDPMAPVCLLSPIKWRVEQKKLKGVSALSATVEPKPAFLEYARLKPYKYPVIDAVDEWNTTRDYLELPRFPCHDGRDAPDWIDTATRSVLTGCILTTDFVFFTLLKDAAPYPAVEYYILSRKFKEVLLDTVKEWLKGSLPWLSPAAVQRVKSSSSVQTICQVCHSEFISIIEEAFSLIKIKPHPITFIVTPLPQSTLVRFRMALSPQSIEKKEHMFRCDCSCFWKNSTEDAVLHTHSVNLWVPSCLKINEFCNAEESKDKTKLEGTCCCSCQAVRCEVVFTSEAALAAAAVGGESFSALFLRGCDGRFPHSGLLPDLSYNSSLKDFGGKPEESPESTEGLNVMLQVTNSFLNMQEAMRLCHRGKNNCGAYSGKIRDKNSDLGDVLQPATYCFPPSCIIIFISVSCRARRNKGNIFMEKDLKTVKRFVKGLTMRFLKRHDTPPALIDKEGLDYGCIVIAAEVPELPGGAKTLMMPLWEIIPPQGIQNKIFLTEQRHPEAQAWDWLENVTVLKRHMYREKNGNRIPDPTSLDEEKDVMTSTFLSISFMPKGSKETESSFFLTQVNRSVNREFTKHFPHKIQSFSGLSKAVDDQGINDIFEIFVFYTEACVHHYLTEIDAETFEHNFMSSFKIRDDRLPAITFFPVKTLAQGCLEILVRSTT